MATVAWLNMDFLFISKGTIVVFIYNDAKKKMELTVGQLPV